MLALAYSNLWIALSAAGAVFTNQALLGLPWDWRPCFLAFSIMFMVYTFAKTIRFDPQADELNDPARTALLRRFRSPLIALSCFLYAISLGLAWRWGVLGFCVFPFLTAVLYEVKFLPAGFRYRRLKDVTGVKSGVVALTWAALNVLLPVVMAGAAWSLAVAVVLAWNFVTFFVNTVFFDIGDMSGDRIEGTVTLPLSLGFRRCRALLLALCVAAAALLWWGQREGLLGGCAGWANLASLYSFLYVMAARREGQDLGFLCDVVADGIYVFSAVCVLIGCLN